jgi:hypothetical protein
VLFREAKKGVAEFSHSQDIDINEEYAKHEKFSLSDSIPFRPLVACRFFRRAKFFLPLDVAEGIITHNPAFRKTYLLEKRDATGQIGEKRADIVAQGTPATDRHQR